MTTLTLESNELTQQLLQLADEKQTRPELLLQQAVLEFMGRAHFQDSGDVDRAFHAAFEREAANFEALKPNLLQRYAGRVVAIYQSKVIEVGVDILDVYAAVVKKHGTIPCYVQWVDANAPRKVRIPSAWKVR